MMPLFHVCFLSSFYFHLILVKFLYSEINCYLYAAKFNLKSYTGKRLVHSKYVRFIWQMPIIVQ